MKILLLMTLFIAPLIYSSELKLPASKKDLKAYYSAINEKAKNLKRVPDDELLKEIIRDCFVAKKYDQNILCLESITEF